MIDEDDVQRALGTLKRYVFVLIEVNSQAFNSYCTIEAVNIEDAIAKGKAHFIADGRSAEYVNNAEYDVWVEDSSIDE